ncbi:MAG: FAD:protein FMN transferase [Gammaproteobacteria bacterium]|nr:FAD:protein FMN transferase [Gammaproteobacteria bacterium]
MKKIKTKKLKLKFESGCWHGHFKAMASPCEVLMEVANENLAEKILEAVMTEAQRIEQKFSRYRDDNIIYKINNANGIAVEVDEETARLIDFSNQLTEMSEGLFDVTSGVLRKVWKFDGSNNVPEASEVKVMLENVGWSKVTWQDQIIQMPSGMEIDLGGVGKEYAVDRCVQIARGLTTESVLINFGGDLATTGERRDGACWSVGRLITGKDSAVALFKLYRGAIATSGDAHRYLLKDGVRYSHVLNPETGWSVHDAAHTVSVGASTCVEAGMMSTLAMLQGKKAKAFLELQEVDF